MGFIVDRRAICQVTSISTHHPLLRVRILFRCVTKPCYHLLRRQDIAKNATVKENLPLILTIMINKFEHARGNVESETHLIMLMLDHSEASIQFIQAVKLYDSNSSLLVTVLNSLLIDYQDTSLAIELLKSVSLFVCICNA